MSYRFVFLLLSILFIMSLFNPIASLTPLLSAIKALVVGFYFMELKWGHKAWMMIYALLIMIIATSLSFIS